MRTLLIITLLLGLSLASPLTDFEQYTKKFNKVYSTPEAAQTAYQNFVISLERIRALDAPEFGLNKFSDMSVEDFRAQRLSRVIVTPDTVKDQHLFNSFTQSLDEHIDWRAQCITPVKDQAQCGSCWAFSAVEEVESMWIMSGKGTNTSTILSPQQVVSCDKNDDGCEGGDTPTAYQYIEKAGGLVLEKDFPYKAKDERCKFDESKIVAKIKGFSYATSHSNETHLALTLAEAPISICVNAEPWMDYDQGIFKSKHCPGGEYDLDHCVQLAGLGVENGVKYWLIRNSWAEDWGEKGYIRIQRDDHNLCGVATEATVVEV